MDLPVNESLTLADRIVLDNLRSSVHKTTPSDQDSKTVQLLDGLGSPTSEDFQPTIFTALPEPQLQYSNRPWKAYLRWATGAVRRPTDVGECSGVLACLHCASADGVIFCFLMLSCLCMRDRTIQYNILPYTLELISLEPVFLNHILLYLCTSLPSAIYLFSHFTPLHAFLHWAWTAYSCGPFTLLMHNSIHNNGVLHPSYRWLDVIFPYLVCPLMGHTVSLPHVLSLSTMLIQSRALFSFLPPQWNSYYYHHTKMHHVEGNGPGDISSTLSYQRDSPSHLLHYTSRFLFTLWYELPIYFIRKGRRSLAIKSFSTEILCYTIMAYFYIFVNAKATVVTLLIPLIQMRIGMAVGNWGQHAFIDRDDPDSDFRSSITLIDVAVSHS